jgi:hypothetical protein
MDEPFSRIGGGKKNKLIFGGGFGQKKVHPHTSYILGHVFACFWSIFINIFLFIRLLDVSNVHGCTHSEFYGFFCPLVF